MKRVGDRWVRVGGDGVDRIGVRGSDFVVVGDVMERGKEVGEGEGERSGELIRRVVEEFVEEDIFRL